MRRRQPELFVFLGLAALWACAGPSKNVPRDIMDKGEHLLVEPVGDPASLLGRAVTMRTEGGLELADSLAPGCEVHAREVSSSWTRTVIQDVDDIAGFSSNLGPLLSLKARYEKGVRVEAVVTNQKTLIADLKGPCGELVVKSVKVGTGRREFQYNAGASGGASGAWKAVSAEGGGGSTERVGAMLSWRTPQAWAFTIGRGGSAAGVGGAELVLEMPERVEPGEPYALSIEAGGRDLWVVVLSCNGFEECDVRSPSAENPAALVPAGESARLSTAEPLGRASKKKMVVIGFAAKGDFARFAPPAGALGAEEASRYAKELMTRLEGGEIPLRRWVKAQFGYVVGAADAPRDRAAKARTAERGSEKAPVSSDVQARLFESIAQDDLEAVKSTLASGAHADQADEKGYTPLARAAEKASPAVAKALIDAGARVDVSSGWPPLVLAAWKNGADMVELLIERGADVNARGALGETALTKASARGHLTIVRALLGAGASPNRGSSLGPAVNTPLCWALQNGHPDVARALIRAGADVDGPSDYPVLLRAAYRGDLAAVKLLLAEKANPDATSSRRHKNKTALMRAAEKGHAGVVRALLDAGARCDLQDLDGRTASDLAKKNGHEEVVRLLENRR